MSSPPLEDRRRICCVGAYTPGIARGIEEVMRRVIEHDALYADKDPAIYLATYSLRNHMAQVGGVCEKVAQYLGWDQEEVDLAKFCGSTHDVGKVKEACRHYRENRKLTAAERQQVDLHSDFSADCLQEIKPHIRREDHPFVDLATEVVRYHHKPYRLTDVQLLRTAYLVKVCDAWVTMQEDRGYNTQLGPTGAYNALRASDFAAMESDPSHEFYSDLAIEFTEAIGRIYCLVGGV